MAHNPYMYGSHGASPAHSYMQPQFPQQQPHPHPQFRIIYNMHPL